MQFLTVAGASCPTNLSGVFAGQRDACGRTMQRVMLLVFLIRLVRSFNRTLHCTVPKSFILSRSRAKLCMSGLSLTKHQSSKRKCCASLVCINEFSAGAHSSCPAEQRLAHSSTKMSYAIRTAFRPGAEALPTKQTRVHGHQLPMPCSRHPAPPPLHRPSNGANCLSRISVGVRTNAVADSVRAYPC
jgi:hypothetical protein